MTRALIALLLCATVAAQPLTDAALAQGVP